MTTRHAGYVVTLKEDIREDDSKAVIEAIKLFAGVVASGAEQQLGFERARREIGERLWRVLYPMP
jgi:hypothetical protein